MSCQKITQPVPTLRTVEECWDIIKQIAAFISQNEIQSASALLKSTDLKISNDPAVLEQAGILCIQLQLWDDAVDAFQRIIVPAKSVKYLKSYARNIQSILKHRPLLYKKILDCPVSLHCDILESDTGKPAITYRVKNSKPQPVTQTEDPVAHCLRQWEDIKDDCINKNTCVALCGIGNGYLLKMLAHQYNYSPLKQEQCVHICEPYPEIITQALMIHDYTGPDGPIEQTSFEWWTGSDWDQQLYSAIRNQPSLPPPVHLIHSSVFFNQIEGKISKLFSDLVRYSENLRKIVYKIYDKRATEDYIEILGNNPPRQPRAMLITSRFTTVLQHSIRNIALGLEKSGWETEIIIEPERHHQNTPLVVLKILKDFEPDVIVHIDHLRRERKNIIPSSIPYLCWIQDDLVNLTNTQAGRSVGLRDFILTCAQPLYSASFDYPARQCIYLNKLTRPIVSGVTNENPGPDLVFVSNSSQQVDLLIDELCEEYHNDPAVKRFVRSCCCRMQNVYAHGNAIYNLNDIRDIVNIESERFAIKWPGKENREQFILRLSSALNNALYRQQALDWVIDIAASMNLQLELYGKGWEDHPVYAKYARGYIPYGKPLELLTHQARFNLQIVPYSCMHQRLLDGITAGGFFLIREHPIDSHGRLIDDFMAEHITAEILNSEDAGKYFAPDIWKQYLQINEFNRKITEHAETDLIEAWLGYKNQGIRAVLQGLPRLNEVSFSDYESLETLINRYIDNPELPVEIQNDQRKFIEDKFSYRKEFQRVLQSIRQLLLEECNKQGLKTLD